jgi:hypothetical protein
MAQTSICTANSINSRRLEDENTPLLGHKSAPATPATYQNDEETGAITSSVDKEPYIDPVQYQNIAGVISVLLLGQS